MTALKTKRNTWPLVVKIPIGAVLGVAAGLAFGPSLSWLGETGSALLKLIRILAGPLVFFAVLDAVLRTEIRATLAKKFVVIVMVNAALAMAIGLGVAHFFQPGRFLSGALPTSGEAPVAPPPFPDARTAIRSLVPANFFEPFLQNSIGGIVAISLLLALALRSVIKRNPNAPGAQTVMDGAALGFEALQTAIGWVIHLMPYAVFAVIAQIVGEKGLAPFLGLAAYVAAVIGALALQVLGPYLAWVRLACGMSLKRFWEIAREPFVTALGTSSSLGALPVTLSSLDKNGVSPAASRLYAVVGTNLNNDGILLYEALAVLIVAQAYGIELSAAQQLAALGSCLIATIGIGGIPDAGLISLSVVLTSVGLPLEILPLLLSVDWLLSRARASTNVLADITGSLVLDHSTKKRASRTS